jgi:hypothetical protein
MIPHESFPVKAIATTRHFSVPSTQMFLFPRSPTIHYPETVNGMICQLPPSLQHLVNNIKVLVTEEEITRYLNLQQPILLASDGCAIPGRASYGWILQIGSMQIAKGKGPAFSDDPCSFQAEGYSMASALLYLPKTTTQRQIQFTQGSRAINKASDWNYTAPNVTMRAEWDIESVILTLHKELHLKFKFIHVNSHQDDTTPVAGLSLKSCLNMEAD